MNNKKILIINGHPDQESFNFGLAEAYKKGAQKSSAKVEEINIRDLDFNPNLQYGYRKRTELEPDLIDAQQKRIICTMDQPTWYYRWVNKCPSHHAMKKLTMNFIGVKSVKITAIGPIRLSKPAFREKWLKKIEKLGERNK